MFIRNPLRLVEAAFKHTSPLQTMLAAQIHGARAEKLAPPSGSVHYDTPYFNRRALLAGRAADKAANLINRAQRQDKEYLSLANKVKRPRSGNKRSYIEKTGK